MLDPQNISAIIFADWAGAAFYFFTFIGYQQEIGATFLLESGFSAENRCLAKVLMSINAS